MSKIAQINKDIRDIILEAAGSPDSGKEAYKCYRCGKCMGVCPWYQLKTVEFPAYRIPQSVLLGVTTSSEDKDELAVEIEELYRCTGCEACLKECPHGVNIPSIIRAIRRILVDYGSYPAEIKSVVSKIYNVGNPLGEAREKRSDWAKELDIPLFKADMEFAYFVCCLPVYDGRLQKVAQAGAKILKAGKVSFGIIGQEEQCCAESIRRAGAEKVFKATAKANIALFQKLGIKKIITTSPHCYSAFKKDYAEFGGNFEVFHQVQIFNQLIKEKKIVPKKPLNQKVVYHDPCTLGRQNNIYDEPREVLKSIPGLELLEIENFCRQNSLCCGGGSGVWLDREIDERMADIRVRQAIETGAQILATTCPYCIQMFEDSIKSLNLKLEVKDVAELLAESI